MKTTWLGAKFIRFATTKISFDEGLAHSFKSPLFVYPWLEVEKNMFATFWHHALLGE